MGNKNLKAAFTLFEYDPRDKKVAKHFKCCVCGQQLHEGYLLAPLNEKAWAAMIKRFGKAEGSWVVGECCFGGFCGVKGASTPDDWFNRYVASNSR